MKASDHTKELMEVKVALGLAHHLGFQALLPADHVQDGGPGLGRDLADRHLVLVVHPDDVFLPGARVMLVIAQPLVSLLDPALGDAGSRRP